ncbi:MAG: hypothetical protein KGH76_05355 [Thaumarchaeota archaeon]|nr:hypothetical protein [Nitrososphaerota archaeon]MDE1843577.1 hypothetical protein [Nitrososphaerota archaeon]
MTLEKICNEIIKSDKNITLVAISHRTDFFYMEKEGVKSLQTKEDVEKALADASLRWVTRRSHRALGEPLYAMAKYEKAKRITVPFGRYGIVLCGVQPDSDAEHIASHLIHILKKHIVD